MSEGGREGRISGYVLKIVRESIGYTQEELAEQLSVDATTVQGWESGRRPLMAVATGSYLALRRSLLCLKVQPRLLLQLDMALEADRFVGHVLHAQGRDIPVTEHPLSSWVITRPFTDLVAWPFTGTAPGVLAAVPRQSPRRGPVATAPHLASDERRHFFDHLKVAAESADVRSVDGMLLRRQAHYIAGFDETDETSDWLTTMQRQEERRMCRSGEWSPSWAVVRSGAHTLARFGDRDALPHFIQANLGSDACETANLNYWAYWLGEVSEPQLADTFMIELSPESWHGSRLLSHLIDKLHSGNPYIDVVVHTLWSLLMRRPRTLPGHPAGAVELRRLITRVLDEREVSDQSRRELEEIFYALRMATR